MIGSKLGPYEITARLGAGGMGEVFRATDSKLKRDVAIKVLPAAFVSDRERLARFEREAQLLAQLNHPNIAQIYGMEASGDSHALVMELVDGATLGEKLEQGRLSLDETLSIARQIAEALEAAHEKGIVHRDLKPQNVKVRADGTVKVLDFGLAKAMDPASSAPGAPANSPTLMHSPTLTAAGTELGMILGTAAYMSPEQARGGAVDKRADIWAFGVVLHEMLSGEPLFADSSVVDTLSAVMRKPIELERLPAGTPPRVRELLRRCLERDVRLRLRDIGEARIALGDPRITLSEPPVTAPAAPAPARPGAARLLPWALAAVALAVAGWALLRSPRGVAAGSDGAVARSPTRLELSLPPGVEPVTRVPAALAVSPDGRKIAMVGFRAGQRRLYIRRLDNPESIEVKDAGGVNAMAFSPDSESVVFVPGGSRVVRVSLADQQSQVVAKCGDLRNSVAWGAQWIYYRCKGEIWRVSPAGGEPTQLTHLDVERREVVHSDPVELPGGRLVLFASLNEDDASSRIEAVALAGGARSVVLENATTPLLAPTGHLLCGIL